MGNITMNEYSCNKLVTFFLFVLFFFYLNIFDEWLSSTFVKCSQMQQ